jgi:hypothetical protein
MVMRMRNCCSHQRNFENVCRRLRCSVYGVENAELFTSAELEMYTGTLGRVYMVLRMRNCSHQRNFENLYRHLRQGVYGAENAELLFTSAELRKCMQAP